MKTLLLLLLTLFTSTFAFAEDCPDGKCIPRLLRKIRLVSEIYKAECLPPKIKLSEIEMYHKEHPLTEQCWRYLYEINLLDEELSKHQAVLDTKTNCETGDCKKVEVKPFFQNIEDILQAVPQNTCTEKRKERIRKRCPDDLKCHFMSAAFIGFSGYYFNDVISKKPKNCHLGDDACSTRVALAFIDTVNHFLKGVGNIIKWSWNKVTGSEDHSSTAQLALAKASEDPSIFEELLTDFPGAMEKVFGAFFSYVETWLKEEVYCKKWLGKPHVGKCLRPLDSFDCLSCKTLLSGTFCSIPGTALFELAPALFSGGLAAAIKHGSKAGAVLYRSIRASTKATNIAKSSKALQVAMNAASATASLSIKAYKVSGLQKVTQASIAGIRALSKKTKAYIAVTPAGKVMVFSKDVIKTTGKVVLYPVDNPLTQFSYKAGANFFDKAIMLGKSSKVGAPPMNVTRGMSKLISPSLMGAHETEKIEEKKKDKGKIKKALKNEGPLDQNFNLKKD